jgi:endonuclease YncB( thermonuclease family)
MARERSIMSDRPDTFMCFAEASPFAIEVPVLKVVDGDGFRTTFDQAEISVRFGFIDAPELDQRGGYEAKEFLTALIGGRNVWIEVLTKTNTGQCVDRHGRVIAVPYLGDRYPAALLESELNVFERRWFKNRSIYLTRNIEIEMVLNGWAWLLDMYGPDRRYFEALEDAKRNKRGIWKYDNNISPGMFKRQKHEDRRRLAKANPVAKCPTQGCGGNLVERHGKFGAFYGCSNYPNCRHSQAISPIRT